MTRRTRARSSPLTAGPVHATCVRIWEATRRIPRGRVSTYGAIATLAGFPGRPRLAGFALSSLPPGADIPWQRVINAGGRVSLPGSAGAHQRALLEKEGVRFRENRVDLSVFSWPATAGKRKKPRRGRI